MAVKHEQATCCQMLSGEGRAYTGAVKDSMSYKALLTRVGS